MNLDDLLAGLEKSAGFPDKEDGTDQKEDKENKDAKSVKKDTKEDKDEQGVEKSAAYKSGSALAREIMEKFASVKSDSNTTKGEDTMNKQASDAGKALAQALLKQAGIGDTNTESGLAPGAVPNKMLQDQMAQRAEHDQIFQSTPGTDGLGNGGTINQIFDSIVQDAQAHGAVDSNMTGNNSGAEGAAVLRQAPNQNQQIGPEGLDGETHEKTAAVISLVNSGYDFDSAVDMVKSASDALESEYDTHVKQAALNDLLDQGVDFDYAVAMVKQASRMDSVAGAVGSAAGKAYGNAAKGATYLKGKATQAGNAIAANKGKSAAGAAGLAAAGGAGAYALGREKKAALDELCYNGVDYDLAVNLVNEKSYELYGA
jgi:hypothetical protein